MVDASRNHQQITRFDCEADPSVGGGLCVTFRLAGEKTNQALTQTSNVEETTAREDVTDLLIFVHMPGGCC